MCVNVSVALWGDLNKLLECEDSLDLLLVTSPATLKISAVHDLIGLVSIVSYSRQSLMTFGSATRFHVYLPWGQQLFSIVS